MRVARIGFLMVILITLVMNLGLIKAGVSFSTEKLELWVDDDPGCGGHSPCLSSIQQAVDVAADWATIWVRPGLYEESVTITKPIKLIGELGGQVIVRSPDPEQPVIQIIGIGGLLQNLTITGGLPGLLVQSSSAQIEFNQIIGNRDAGVLIQGGSPLLRRNEIGWTTAVCSKPWNIRTCEGGDGIRVANPGVLGPWIIGNTISHNQGWGIAVVGSEGGTPSDIVQIRIEQNRIINNGLTPIYGGGLTTEGVVSASIENNQIEENPFGILSGSQTGLPVDLVIKRNTVSRNGTGIAVNEGLKVELSYNQLCNNSFTAISLFNVKQARVAHNVIQSNDEGLRIGGLAINGQLTISYNKIWDNEWYGLRMIDIGAGRKVEIYRNEILTSGWGVWLVNVRAKTTMEQNSVEGNEHGVVVDRSLVMLNENRIVRNEG